MNAVVIKELLENLSKEKNVCAWSQLYSALTWNRIGFSRSNNLFKTGETTITEDLLFDFWLLAAISNLPVEIFQSKNESANGSDLEIFVETTDGYIFIPCQAKILKRDNRYGAMDHKVKGINQIDLLINYAKGKKGIPMYMLYNYSDYSPAIKNIEKESGLEIDLFGVSFVSATFLKNTYSEKRTNAKGNLTWKIPNFQDLHPTFAFPFCFLFCWITHLPQHALTVFMNFYSVNDPINYFSKETIVADQGWRNMAPPATIGRIRNEGQVNSRYIDPDSLPVFNPKYRLVISRFVREGALLRQIG